MLEVAQKLFSKGGHRSGIASTHLVPPLRTMVPFILPSQLSLTQPTRCGRGMIVPVTATANQSTVIKHNLGRFVQFAIPLWNNGAFTPQYMFDTGHGATRTQQKQSVIFNVGCNPCLVLFF